MIWLRNLQYLLLLLIVVISPAWGSDANAISQMIDTRLSTRFQQEGIVPAPAADDAEFLRRVHLDLIGRPPSADQVRGFLASTEANKRHRIVEELLADPQHADHFARTWRALLLPEADSDSQLRYFVPGLEAWLRQRALDGAGFDAIVQELLCVPIAGPNEPPQMVLRDLRQPNPIAFIASKNGDPATVAASSSRLFLGIRLECAQCHNHPFETWTQQQFWNQAAYFAGIERRGRSTFSPLVESIQRREIAMQDSQETVPAVLLTGHSPPIPEGLPARRVWAEWLTSPDNPYFARAIVNRTWGQLMGAGFVEPVDDFGSGNLPSHPDLLDDLAESFRTHRFQLRVLIAGICQSEAYQRTSRTTHPSQTGSQVFAKMAIKPMSGEQFFQTVAQAVDYAPQVNRLNAGRDEDPVRRRILNEFASADAYSDPETSVSQALTLMNGRLINDAAESLMKQAGTDQPLESTMEALFLKTLARFPTADEQATLIEHFVGNTPQQRSSEVGDLMWALLNTAEFRWNH